jgi:hypothetical protein
VSCSKINGNHRWRGGALTPEQVKDLLEMALYNIKLSEAYLRQAEERIKALEMEEKVMNYD